MSGLMIGIAHADEKEELLKLRNTTVNLIKQLVKQGVLNEKTAQEMIKQAEVDAGKQAAAQSKGSQNAEAGAEAKPVPADEVRVTYVPDFIKDQIRQQVRSELREEVVGDVMQKAKQEQWGIANALPEWTRRFKLSGDLRLREQSHFYSSSNFSKTYQNWQFINTQGGQGANGVLGAGLNGFLNTTSDRNFFRERFRLGIDVDIANGVDAGIRLATGNTPNPVSTNQTLGNTGAQYQFNLDRAFLRYNAYDDNHYNWLTVMGGRSPNPFFTAGSEVVWDEDLSFEGVSATLRQRLRSTDLSDDIGGKGPSFFITGGVFPLQTANIISGLTTHDKWLYGGQLGMDWGFDNQDSLQFAGAYYDYENIKAVLNQGGQGFCTLNSPAQTQSAPQFMQGGNSLVSICESIDSAAGGLVGLASDFKILNLNVLYDLALFSPTHLKLSADFAKNIGFTRRQNATFLYGSPNEQTVAWQFKADLGWPKLNTLGNWNVFTGYRHVERDAVLDAYTDSDFHNGGTNVKGWFLGGNYALMKNIWLTGRWMNGDIISGQPISTNNPSAIPFGLNILQLDLNSRF
jgi:hypothetical protein